jgi:hypothetical protein
MGLLQPLKDCWFAHVAASGLHRRAAMLAKDQLIMKSPMGRARKDPLWSAAADIAAGHDRHEDILAGWMNP